MKEAFLHYIWRYQKLKNTALHTEQGEQLIIINQGKYNTNAGPDFLEAKLKIGPIEWCGAVELHVKSSDWFNHKHHNDPKYDNVILHVVWEDDKPICIENENRLLPTIVLRDLIDMNLYETYEELCTNRLAIPCQGSWAQVSDFIKSQMLQSVGVERIQSKANKAYKHQILTHDDWEETIYFMLFSAMGFKVNSATFERLTEEIPYRLLRKYQTNLFQIQALLFGASGLLEDKYDDEIRSELKKEWEFLKHKHQINSSLKSHDWNFLRLRPANFPTVRLGQLSMILYKMRSLMEVFVQDLDLISLKNLLQVDTKNYWSKSDVNHIYKLGKPSIEHIILNVVPSILSLYASSTDNYSYMEEAIACLEQLKPENNSVIRKFKGLGLEIDNAFTSQATLQLHNEYCQKKRCLDCKIGVAIMTNSK